MSVSLSVVVPFPSGCDTDDALRTINRQTDQDFQLILVADDERTHSYLEFIKSAMKAGECTVVLRNDRRGTLEGLGIANCNRDFVWICGIDDNTTDDFVEKMKKIQRNIGADAILTDCSCSWKLSKRKPTDEITVFRTASGLNRRYHPTIGQWTKFFRRSLVIGTKGGSIESFADAIMGSNGSFCYFDSKMFSDRSFPKFAHAEHRESECQWSLPFSELKDNLVSNAKKIPITIGICAYNEQYVIEKTVESIFTQNTDSFVIDGIIIVSSGSTDDTDRIIRALAEKHPIIRPIFQAKREGKNSAVNEIMRNARTEIVILYNSDNILSSEYSLDMLVRPFFNEKVGNVGGHPVPINGSNSFIDFTVRMVWEMNHNVSMISPNSGELIAFRNVGIELPTDMQGDEGIIRHTVESKGYVTEYAPCALILNKGPTTFGDYMGQRRRVNIGERYMLRKYKFEHPTHGVGILAKAILATTRHTGPHPLKTLYSVFIELLSRAEARIYVMMDRKDMSVWEQIKTTKKI